MADRNSRRRFLKSTLAGASGLLICESRLAFGYTANSKLNIAAIGVGGRGNANLNGVRSESIVALCDADERQAGNARKRFSGAKFFRDYRKMLDKMGKGIDAVLVSTPDHTHAVSAIAAMKLGKHIYCEKPLTRTVEEARQMRLVAERQKVVTQMGNQGSDSEGVRRATEWAWAGTVGTIREAYLWVGDGNGAMKRPTDKPDIPKELSWDLWLGPAEERPYHPSYLPRSWRGWSAFGSGGLGDMGCHTGNFLFRGLHLERLFDEKTAGGKSKRRIRIDGEAKNVHDEGYPSSTLVRFSIPARGDLPAVQLTVSSGADVRPSKDLLHGENPGSFGSLLIGEKASIYSSNPWNVHSTLLPKDKVKELPQPKKTLPRGVGHYREFINACKGNGKTFSPFSIGGPLTELIQLANVSGRVGEPFDYDPVTGEISNNAKASGLLHREYRKGWSL